MADLRQLVEEFFDAFNSHDEQRIRDGYAGDVVFEGPGAPRLEGAEAATEFAMSFIRAFPDVRLTQRNVVAEGEWVVAEMSFEGTHQAPLEAPGGTIPARNKRVSGTGVDILRVRDDGKVVEERLYFDQFEFLTQLGVIPEPATA